MRKLCAALLLSFVGMSTYASDPTPKAKPNMTTLEIKTASKEGKFEVSAKKQSIEKVGRRQMMFTFTDPCGVSVNVWVSGPSSAPDSTLLGVAQNYAFGPYGMGGGCF